MRIDIDDGRGSSSPRSQPWFLKNPYVLAGMWISTGLALIFFNKVIISVWDFHYPFLLTFLHQIYAVLVTKLLHSYTPLLSSVKSDLLTWEVYLRKVPLLALAYSGALVLGNSAIKYLSLSYIQMLKSLSPLGTWFGYTFILGRQKLDYVQLSLVIIICSGTMIASLEETYWSWIGFILQFSAITSDCLRMILMDNLTIDVKLDTLSTLYYMAPLASCFLGLGFLVFESKDFFGIEGGGMDMLLASPALSLALLLNASLAMALNCCIVLFITNAGIMTMSLGGIAKDILVVLLSVLLFKHSVITGPQIGGYLLSVLGLATYREHTRDPEVVPLFLRNAKDLLGKQLDAFLCCLKIGRGAAERQRSFDMYEKVVQGEEDPEEVGGLIDAEDQEM